MNVFCVSCSSGTGAYFAAYLQSVTVIATDKADALALVKDYLTDSGQSFVRPEKDWHIDLLAPAARGVVDTHTDSDY